ncbi:MAG: hypothetical protein IKR40_06060 [Treponema sp.]|nr:hypothetical protein [Treponema sp.]
MRAGRSERDKIRKVSAFVLLVLIFAVVNSAVAFSEDWVLASTPFTFTQKGTQPSSQQSVAKLLPKLILDQIGTESIRVPPRTEMLDRTLENLRTERQSLFLQLSAAVKTRDSILLTEDSGRKLRKKIKESEKKIREIENQIDENLKKQQKAVAEVMGESVQEEKKKNAFESFLAHFTKEEAAVVSESVEETVAVYKSDSSLLFEPGDLSTDSREFEKSVIDAKINGLLYGTLTFYGNYFSATVELKIYPGGKSMGSVTEVGSLGGITEVASNIAQFISPLIVNSSGVKLYFDITPEDAASSARISVDGTVTQLSGYYILVPAGMHTLTVESPGYVEQSFTGFFRDSPSFFIHVPMSEQKNGTFSLYMKNPGDGTLYANGKSIGSESDDAQVTIDGVPVIGQVIRTVPGDDGEDKVINSFYYVPEKLQVEGAELVVKAEPLDLGALIDKRRVWAYRGYTAFVLTLPLTFFAVGNYNQAYNGYLNGVVEPDEVYGWHYLRLGAIGLTALAGGFFIFELVRYIHTASKVLPVEAKPGSKPLRDVIEKIEVEQTAVSDDAEEESDSKE